MKVRINTHGNPMPAIINQGDWIDLMTAEEVTLKNGEFKILSLGVSMELPEGYFAMVVPRSSTYKRWGILLANSVGIIDNSYRGDGDVWGFPAIALRDVTIPKGTRIAQFCVMEKQERIRFEQVQSLDNPDRGGFGSTGE